MATHKKMKGGLTISRPRGGDTEYIEISATDGMSGTQFLSLRVGLMEFAEALTGLAYAPCEFDLRPDRVGLQCEHKEEFVLLPDSSYYAQSREDRQRIAAEAFKSFEIDGWKGRVDDFFNPHRRGSNGARVTFTRYVAPEDQQ